MLLIGHFILLFGSDLSDYLSYIFLLFILVVFLISLCTSLCHYLAHFLLIEKSYFRCFLYMLFILYASSLRDRVTNSSVCLLLFIFYCDVYQIICLFSFHCSQISLDSLLYQMLWLYHDISIGIFQPIRSIFYFLKALFSF